MPGCSKASRGLSVLPRVQGIFTLTTISPGPSARQCGSRWTIHAGRNLPDKEFRYLRTVIVTAAVYRGFGSGLSPLPLTFRHWAGCSPHTSSFEFAETCVFGKQSPPPILCGPRGLQALSPTPPRAPLLPQLRGQFAEFLTEGSPERLGAFTPAHLCRFAVRSLRLHRLGVLSRQYGFARFALLKGSPSVLGVSEGADLPTPSPYYLGPALPSTGSGYPPASPPSLHRSGAGILTRFPSATPFGLALGAG